MASPFQPGSLVAAYLRDSGGNDQDVSTIRQEDELRTWCDVNHVQLTRVFKDVARSGTSIVGLFCFGWISDIFTILGGGFKDAAGSPLR